MTPERAVFAFFPYLVTSERFRLRGIEFRSNQDIAYLPAEAQEHLTTLSQMFFLEDGVRIEQMTCTPRTPRRQGRAGGDAPAATRGAPARRLPVLAPAPVWGHLPAL